MFAKPCKWLKDKDRKPFSYEGVVVDNVDPLKLGRVRVRVPQIHGKITDTEYIPTEDLPWINQRPNSFLGNSSNSGSFSVPEIDSKVVVEYPTSDPYFGYYKGGITSTETRTTVFDEDYPHSYGTVDSSGTVFRVNKMKETWDFIHPSGNYIKISQDTTIDIFQNSGNRIRMNPDGTVDIITTTLNIQAATTNMSGDLNVAGAIHAGGNITTPDCLSSGKSGATHQHLEQGDGAPTSPPL